MQITIPTPLIKLANLLSFDIFITGGYLRNAITNLGNSDLDLAGAVSASEFLLPSDYSVAIVNKRLGTAIIKCPTGEQYEYTPFRIESYGADGKHAPVSVSFTNDIKSDALRRDFCCNAMYLNVRTKEFIDFFGGKKDCINKVLRAMSQKRFLRMMV